MTLTPTIAMPLFVLAVWAGYRFRAIWKAEGPTWQLWIYGLISALSLLTLGLVPMQS